MSRREAGQLGLLPSKRKKGERSVFEIATAAQSARVGGGSAKRSGRAFESMVNAANLYYRRRGDAVITQCHPSTVGPPGHMTFREASDVDYIGTLRGGRPIAFDAKATTESSFQLADARPRVQAKNERQCGFLFDFQKGGGIAFYLIHHWELEVTWIVDAVDRLLAGEKIVLCERKRGHDPVHILPFVADAAVIDLARGLPAVPWLSLIP